MKLKHWPTLLEYQIGEIRPCLAQVVACRMETQLWTTDVTRPYVSIWLGGTPPVNHVDIICLITSWMNPASEQAREDVPGSVPVADTSYRGRRL